MNGNWSGPYSGSNSGNIVVEVDDMGDFFEGCAYAYDSNTALPATFALIKTPNKGSQLQFKAPVIPLHPHTGEPTVWAQISSLYDKSIVVPQDAEVQCEWTAERLKLNWKTDIGTTGAAEIPKSRVEQPSTITPLSIQSWAEFKEYVTQLQQYRYIYRGQTNTWRLRTPFHRTGRGDMRRFFMTDVPALHRHLTARTRHVFDLSNALQNAAFLNLAQHHGYPTPLLDWTYSPFVGAFFAFHRIKSSEAASASADQKVRIFIFDRTQWCTDIQQILSTAVRWSHFSIVEPIALSNERLIPQQALSSFTTVDDIETYIQSKENAGKRYLQVIDLPVRERDLIIRELSLMGVTPGSLFPGLEGACEELRERFFRF